MNQSTYHEEIARQAYLLYQARGMMPGGDLADWLEAERLCKMRSPSQVGQSAASSVPQIVQREPASPFRANVESPKEMSRDRKRGAGRDDVRTHVPHPAARLTLNRGSNAASTR